jgi:hypothetical protein
VRGRGAGTLEREGVRGMRARGHAWNRVIFVNNQPLSAFTEKTGLRQCG